MWTSTYNLDPACLEACITPPHQGGYCGACVGTPCDMESICRIAHAHGVLVIEDCAHAHGALYHGRKTGTLGDIAMFSFQGSKVMVAGRADAPVRRSCLLRAGRGPRPL